MKNFNRFWKPLLGGLTLLLFLLTTSSLQGQFFYGLTQEYGKNRVQFNEFDWVYYRFQDYDIYFYRGNEHLAQHVARLAEKNLPRVEKYLDANLDERIQIMVFNTVTDLKQSNVNLSREEDFNDIGITRVAGRRLFVYFNGDYTELEIHLRKGLAQAVLTSMKNGSFTQSVANSALLNLPPWFSEGLISFVGEKWSPQIDHRVADGFYTERYRKINSLSEEEARYAGHSFWRYVEQTYGSEVIRNIVYLAIVNRDIESGFRYILGKSLEDIMKSWQDFYKRRYKLEEVAQQYEDRDELIKLRKKHRVTRIATSPDGRYLAYVDQRFSRYRLYLYDLERDRRQRILAKGSRIAQNADYSYPVLAWHPRSKLLTFFTEKKGISYLNFYNLEKEELESKPFYRFDKVRSAEYSPDGKQLLLSAVQNGRSDIYLYTVLNTKIQAITYDDYDDFSPTFFDGGDRIAWTSNRPTDTLFHDPETLFLPSNKLDIFATERQEIKAGDTIPIWQLTDAPGMPKEDLQEYQPGILTFRGYSGGLGNQHFIKIDSSIAYVDTTTHYEYQFTQLRAPERSLHLVDQGYAPRRGARYDLVYFDRRYRVYEEAYLDPQEPSLVPLDQGKEERTPSPEESADLQDSGSLPALYYPGVAQKNFPVDIHNYRFGQEAQEAQDDPESSSGKAQDSTSQDPLLPEELTLVPSPEAQPRSDDFREDTLEIPGKRNYFLSFYESQMDFRFDNMFRNYQYQPFTGQVSGGLLNQGFNANVKVGVRDLLQDYSLIGAVSSTFQPLPGTSLFPNAEYLLAVGNYKKRMDREYSYRRRSNVQFRSASNYQRLISNVVEAQFTWPFSPVGSIRGTVGFRLDEDIPLARDFNRIEDQITYNSRALARLAYVYDNSRKIGLNLRAGLRYKVFTEYYRAVDESPSGLHTAGLDARHYLPLHRNLIWANRLAAGASWGPEKLIHIMGGVDNAFGQETNPATPIARENNYVFQTLITNMRGFIQNIRNGNNFAVINSEVRWPFLSYLANRPLRNDFLNNLMVIGFADLGSAWNGIDPYAEENAINTRSIPFGGGGEIVLDSQKDPFVLGTGFGLRSRLFGYYIRADWAWGIEDGIILPQVFYFSIGTDF